MSTARLENDVWGESGKPRKTVACPPSMAAGVRRIACLVLGCLSLAMAVLGVILPGLPATPFLLLSSFFLVRSSPKLHGWLIQSRIFGSLLEDWHRHRGVDQRVKVAAVVMVLGATSSSIAFYDFSSAARTAFLVAAAVGLAVVLRLPVVERGQPAE